MDTSIVSPDSGIYKILNTKNGKIYIGSAVNIKERWKIHLWHLRNGTHHNRHLQRAWNKYGEETFSFIVLEVCEPDILLEREQSYLPVEKTSEALIENGFYNISPVAGNTQGVALSDERKQKISQKAKERFADPKIRKQMSESSKRQWEDPEIRKRILDDQSKKIEALTNRNNENWKNQEYIDAMTDAIRKRWQNDDYRENVTRKNSESAKKRMQDPELRKRLSESVRKLWENPEYRARMTEARNKRKSR